MSKYYFMNVDDEHCHTKKDILDMMKWDEVETKEVFEAVRETGTDYFYCKEHGEVGDISEGDCGRSCSDYAPRNGKSGCCKHRGYCYTPGNKVTFTISNPLTK